MIQLLTTKVPLFTPIFISSDYNKGLINTFQTFFPNTAIEGCLFHLVQNILKKISTLGLQNHYNTDAQFALNARMIFAMAFVPLQKIEEALHFLQEEVDDELMPVLDYFEDTYMDRRLANNCRRVAMFPYAIWGCYERTISRRDRTNNFAEAAHRRLQVDFGVKHPRIWNFINTLKKIQKSNDAEYELFIRGDERPTKR